MSRARPSTGLASFLKAEIFAREQEQIEAQLSKLYTETKEYHRSPPALVKKIQDLKADLAAATRRAETKPKRRYL